MDGLGIEVVEEGRKNELVSVSSCCRNFSFRFPNCYVLLLYYVYFELNSWSSMSEKDLIVRV
jgi:hypothetical protein